MDLIETTRIDDALLDFLGDRFQNIQPGRYRSFEQYVDWFLLQTAQKAYSLNPLNVQFRLT